jgi:phage gp36-like protein
MAYSTEAHLKLVYGKANIQKWADADNNLNASERSARIAWAIESADEHINARLRLRGWTIPFTSTPVLIRDISAMLAGAKLYEFPRGIVDGDEADSAVAERKVQAETMLDDIVRGYLKLDVDNTCNSMPFVVKEGEAVVRFVDASTEAEEVEADS